MTLRGYLLGDPVKAQKGLSHLERHLDLNGLSCSVSITVTINNHTQLFENCPLKTIWFLVTHNAVMGWGVSNWMWFIFDISAIH